MIRSTKNAKNYLTSNSFKTVAPVEYTKCRK